MIQATDLKNGTTFLMGGSPYKVIKYNHIKVGRGGATVRVSSRNLATGAIEEKTFSSNIKVEELFTQKVKLQFLYKDAKNAIFMNPKSFEQVEISQLQIKDELIFIKEGQEVEIVFAAASESDSEPKALSIELPPKVTLKVSETEPGVKGNSAVNIYKPATLENGFVLKVPLFINMGDSVVVDTRTGEYVERAKS